MSRRKVPINEQTIGGRLRKYRESQGWNTRTFSELLGISQGSLSDIENNRTKPSSVPIENLVLNTDIDIYWLFTGKGEPVRKPCEILKSKLRQCLLKPLFSNAHRIGDISSVKVFQVIMFFSIMFEPTKTKLAKLLFYADFMHYREYGKPITNVSYIKRKYGPVPDNYSTALGILEDVGLIETAGVVSEDDDELVDQRIKPKHLFKSDIFSKTEFDILRKIALHLAPMSNKELTELCNNEPFYEQIQDGVIIPYELAHKIQLKI